MNKPVLIIMAAGMGSRYGGLKQIDPVDEEGNKIIDYSIYDAMLAGFEKFIFIIKKENEKDFRECVGDRIGDKAEIVYAYQELTNLPDGFTVPDGRIKPWGTAHAVLSAKDYVDGPFAVINADDFYGRDAFKLIYDFLTLQGDTDKYNFAMVGYDLRNTLTENGYVSRGVCEVKDGLLSSIIERTHIIKKGNDAAFSEDEVNYTDISGDSVVSMNLWGFTHGFMDELKKSFEEFLKDTMPGNPIKAECYLPFVVEGLLKDKKATVSVLTSHDRWYGVTYKEDKPFVMQGIKSLKEKGMYPDKLF